MKIEWVKVKAGQFIMGAHADERYAQSREKPRHQVTLAHDFWMSKYEITHEQHDPS